MLYHLIEGTYRLFRTTDEGTTGYEPDGDSIRFKPTSKRRFRKLSGRQPRFNGGNSVQLRLDGIDALEIHYGGTRQHRQLAEAARDRLLEVIGFKHVEYDEQGTHVTAARPHPLPGYILTQEVDRNRRPISFAFVGKPRDPDCHELELQPDLLRKSLNALLVEEGLAYPAYYNNLSTNVRKEITHIANEARKNNRGVWAADLSFDGGATVRSTEDLVDLALWPKLFRRLVDYFHTGHSDINGFLYWLQRHGRENNHLKILPTSEHCRLNDVLEVDQGCVRMKYLPQEIVVQ